MRIGILRALRAEGLIGGESLERAEALERGRLFSLFWELRLLLYIGVLLLTGGLGILVYKNIDTIGHQAVLAFIALVAAGSFFYCFRKRSPFSLEKVVVADPFFDYVLLLGCLSLLIFLGYLQYEYDVFGDHYGSATFIPMVVLFFVAYFFDHLGVLSLAITNLAAWAGVAITPLTIWKEGNFSDVRLIWTGILLGFVLLGMGHVSLDRRVKAHFAGTYTNFGLHLFFIASLAGLFRYDRVYLLWFVALMGVSWFLYGRAMARGSFYYIVVMVLYGYIALCYVVLRLLMTISGADIGVIGLGFLYFVLSAVGVALLLVRLNRKLKYHARS
jgi:hypothetical protein